MLFDEVIGQESIKRQLQTAVAKGRIPHAQLFVGREGTGTLAMAIAYAQYLLCRSSDDPEVCRLKCEKLQHSDLHFTFPVNTNDIIKKNPISDLFLNDWRNFVLDNPYGNLFDWLQHSKIGKKQGIISVNEAADIAEKLRLKSYEGGFKILIIWRADKMNIATANKLLKLLEEPPPKTIFLLTAEEESQIIATVRSRCQMLYFSLLSQQAIASALVGTAKISSNQAMKIAHQSEGNYNKALHLLQNSETTLTFEKWFINWVRTAFKAKGNISAIQGLIQWSETIAATGRETQKQFLQYCLQFFRQALLYNYKLPQLVFLEVQTADFSLSKFAPFVHGSNIVPIEKELNDALYYIERNGNEKIILLDLSIKLTRLLHLKEAAI